MFVTIRHAYPSLIFAGEVRSLPLECWPPIGSFMFENIRQGWKGLTVTNTLAYYEVELITPRKTIHSISRRTFRGTISQV